MYWEIRIGNKNSASAEFNTLSYDDPTCTPNAVTFCNCCREIFCVVLMSDSYKLAALGVSPIANSNMNQTLIILFLHFLGNGVVNNDHFEMCCSL